MHKPLRRNLLVCLASLSAGPFLTVRAGQPQPAEKSHVAAVVTEYRHNSHADVIVGRVVQGYRLDDRSPFPSLKLASLYTDQVPERDTSRALAAKHGFPLCGTVREALTLGTDKLAVDGVLLIAEHGRYPKSKYGQVEYPKRRLFTEIVKVFRETGRVAPVFTDKHLAHNWEDAKWIYETARWMNIPLMAGSSVPTYRREPAADVRRGAPLAEIVAVGYGGTESYGFHALEMLQCLAERRRGGETGVKAVQCLRGEAVWAAGREGRFDERLLRAALDRQKRRPVRRPSEAVGSALEGRPTRRTRTNQPLVESVRDPVAFLIEYRDGLKGAVLMLNGAAREFSSAWKYADGTIESTLFALQDERPWMHFATLLQGIESMIHSGKPAWPAERTLLVTGVLHAAMVSRHENNKRLATGHLDIRYQSNWEWRQPRIHNE